MTGEQSPFSPSGIAGGPLTEVEPDRRPRNSEGYLVGPGLTPGLVCGIWVTKAEPLTDAEHAEAYAIEAHAEASSPRLGAMPGGSGVVEVDARGIPVPGGYYATDARAFVGKL